MEISQRFNNVICYNLSRKNLKQSSRFSTHSLFIIYLSDFIGKINIKFPANRRNTSSLHKKSKSQIAINFSKQLANMVTNCTVTAQQREGKAIWLLPIFFHQLCQKGHDVAFLSSKSCNRREPKLLLRRCPPRVRVLLMGTECVC